MKLPSSLFPLTLFSILSVTYGQSDSKNDTTSCTSSSCPTTPYNITYQFCSFSLASEEANVTEGYCPNDSQILNISDYFNYCDIEGAQVCMWNPFGGTKRINTTISGPYCPRDGRCADRIAMFSRCDDYIPCQRGLDCNATFNACIHTNALIGFVVTAIVIVLGFAVIIVIRKNIKYRNQVKLNDYDDCDDEGGVYMHDNGSNTDSKNFAISLPKLVYKPNPSALNMIDPSMGNVEGVNQPNKRTLLTDDLMLFDSERK